MRLRAQRRPGLSLLEVLVATAVFLMSIVSIGFLMSVASNSAMDAHIQSQAANLAQMKLAEVAIGAVALEGQSDATFEDDPEYHYSLTAEQGGASGLYNVTVTVWRTKSNNQKVEVSLSQLVLDPSIVGSVFDTAGLTTADSSTTATTDSGTTGTGSSTTGGASGASGASNTGAPASGSTPSGGGASAGGAARTGGGTSRTGGGSGGGGGGTGGGVKGGGGGGMGGGMGGGTPRTGGGKN